MLKKVAALAGVLVLAGCGSSETAGISSPTPTPTPAPSVALEPAELTLGVWGADTEIAGWGTAVKNYNASTELANVSLRKWATDADMMKSFADPDAVLPDVFLISRADLAQLENDKQVAPVDDLLDARNVDIGDEYSRDALEALSKDVRLECMPYGVSPQVVYYNTDLVDFPRMERKGIEVPNIASSKSWTWNQFQLAAQEASTNAGVIPFALTPSLAGLAPFLLAAGGGIENEDGDGLGLAEGDNLRALENVLPVLANSSVTTTMSPEKQVKLFKAGKLAMMVGDRNLTPGFRTVSTLRWDVLPIPTIEDSVTVGDYTALCISAKSERIGDAADLLVNLVSPEGVRPVAAAGYLVPVNQRVALTDDFQQSELSPLHANVFPYTVRKMKVLPFTEVFGQLEAAVAPALAKILTPGQIPVTVEAHAEAVDRAAEAVLVPLAAAASASAEADSE